MNFSNVLNDEKQLIRLIWLIGAALIVVAIAFGAYYYWDRYVSVDDVSPIEMGVTELEHAVRENPEDPALRLDLANFYYQGGMFAQSLEQSGQVLLVEPENDAAMFIVGMSHIRLGHIEAALEPLEQFAEIRRQSAMAKTDTILETALYFLGESYLKLERPEDAIAVLTEALEIDYTDADAMYQLGMAYAQTGEHELAIEQYHEAIRFVPDFTEVYSGMIVSYSALDAMHYVAYARGMEAYSLKDMETARTHLQSATNNLPDFMPAYLGAGLTFEQLGELETAESYLSHAAELAPDNFLVTNSLQRVQLALENVSVGG